jgi:hypothetical protein
VLLLVTSYIYYLQKRLYISFYPAERDISAGTWALKTTSRLPVRYDGLQQYPYKLSIKKISKIFINCLRSLYNIFFDLAN